MSILLGAADPVLLTALLVAAVLVSLVAAAVCGVFSPKNILGPPRLGENEKVSDIAVIVLVGFLSWVMAQSVFVAFRQLWYQHAYHVQQPPTRLSDAEIVLFNGSVLLIVFVSLFLITVLWRRQGLKRLGFTLQQFPTGVWKGAMAISILMPIMAIASIGTDYVWLRLRLAHPPEHELLTILRDAPQRWVKLAVVISAAIVAPLAEETFFRGHVQTAVRYAVGSRWVAIITTSMLFAAIHPWWTSPPIFLLALGLGYLYERTGNLWACIVMHSLFNCASMALFYCLPMMRTTT